MKTESASLRNQAYSLIRSHLLSGALPGGSVISEPKLAKRLGIGRTPIREAIQQLEVEGLLQRTPRQGTVVISPERQDIVDLFELREGVESFAAFLAAQRINSDALAKLDSLCRFHRLLATRLEESGMKALGEDELQKFLAADMGFHMLLINETGNQRLIKVISDSHALSRIFGAVRQEHTLQIVSQTAQAHGEIVAALQKGDAEKARSVMAAHIHQSLAETLEHFDQQQRRNSGSSLGAQELSLPPELTEEFERMGLRWDAF